eukprot:s164_g20.t2
MDGQGQGKSDKGSHLGGVGALSSSPTDELLGEIDARTPADQSQHMVFVTCGTLTFQPLGVGTNKWGTDPAKFSEPNIRGAFETSLSAGVTLLNTAQLYGTSENCIGQLRGRVTGGEKALVISKFDALGKNTEQLIPSLEESASKCGVDALDGFLIHHPKGSATAMADQLAAAYQRGIVRNVGVSNYDETALREMHALLKERGVPLVFNEELGVTILAWAPLASGRLTSKPSTELLTEAETVAALSVVRTIATSRQKTPAQVALNWCICKGTVPIPGARTVEQARENAGALGWRLTEEEVASLDAVAVDSMGMYYSPEAIYTFFGLWPPACANFRNASLLPRFGTQMPPAARRIAQRTSTSAEAGSRASRAGRASASLEIPLEGNHAACRSAASLFESQVTKLARERRQKAKENVEPTAEWGRPPPKPEHQSKQSNTSMRAALDRRCVKALAPDVARRLQAAREEWGTVQEPAPEPASKAEHKEAKVTPRRSEPKPEREPAPKAIHEDTPGCQGQDEEDPDRARAVGLFQSFLERGRNAENWRKNDLRLINHIVVPMLFGDASIDWARPALALDELEELVRSFPEKLALLPRHKDTCDGASSALPDRHTSGMSGGNDPSKEAAGRPPAMPGTRSPLSAEGAVGAGLRSRAGTGDSGKRCSERRSPQSDSTRTTRSASPSRAVTTHQEAIRARREALEQARQESLQKALSKKDGGGQNRQERVAIAKALTWMA